MPLFTKPPRKSELPPTTNKQKPSSAPGAAADQQSSSQGAKTGEDLDSLPLFKDTPATEKQELFKKKLRLCGKLYDFTSDLYAREKDMKRLNLLEIMDHINTAKNVFNEQTHEEIITMITKNLFRGLQVSAKPVAQYDPEEDEPTLEAAWPHLQYVYEFLLRFVVNNDTDPKVVKKYINQDFLLKLLDLFDSEDPRERDYLKTILHRIYGKFMPHRGFIRKSINNIFYRFIYWTERHNGIAELLEILGSIINGFALPLKEEHTKFLKCALLPLHKVRHVAMYHQQLSYCVTQFVEKDPRLAEIVLGQILQYWPITAAKEVLFLGEVEEILEMTQPEEFFELIEPLFARISTCLSSPHFQVAERSLFLWNNDTVWSMMKEPRCMKLILPVIAPKLVENESHWNMTVTSINGNVKKLCVDETPSIYNSAVSNAPEKAEQKLAEAKAWDEQWESMRKQALQKLPGKAFAESNSLPYAARVRLATSDESLARAVSELAL